MPFLSQTVSLHPESPALIAPDEILSYAALDEAAERIARRLVTAGVGPGDLVALKGVPTSSAVSALHGIWKAGGCVAPLNPRWTPREEAQALELLRPHVVLFGEEEGPPPPSTYVRELLTLAHEPADPNQKTLGSVRPDTGPLSWLAKSGEEWSVHPAVHLLTSGTSGVPKVVTLTHANLRANAEGARQRLELSPSDRWLASLSIAHVGGLALVSRAALLGSALVLRGSFQAEAVASMIAEGDVTHASLVPTMLHQLLVVWGEKPVPNTLKCLLIGGAHADTALLQRALGQGFPLALTYGLTEASSQVATAPPTLLREKPGTVGKPLEGIDLRLGAEGEILVRGETVARGESGADGWLHTGDLARLDDDGDLWVTGRLSHRIISGGINVDPAEVEAVIMSHSGVREVAVVGIPHPKWGEEVVAVVVMEDGQPILTEALDRLVRAALSPGKRPKAYTPIPVLPRNANGKVDREKLRTLLVSPPSDLQA